MAAFFLMFHQRRALRRERVFRDRSQALDIYNDDELISRYRFPRDFILQLTDLLAFDIQRPTGKGRAIPPHVQVLTTLRFLAKWEYLSETSDIHGISKSSASRIVEEVCEALSNRLENISMPTGQQLQRTKENFYQLGHFPNVIGCIDGTLIPIQAPSGPDEPSYVCRKGYHAINVQAVCDADMKFTNIVVRWPGCTHDAFILANSALPATTGTANNGWLLGDSGYPLKTWLITPILNIQTAQEQRFNDAHATTRNVVERSFGLLKARFRCLHKTAGALPYSPVKSVKIIESCFKLHNEAEGRNLPVPNVGNVILDNDNIQAVQVAGGDAFEVRRRLVSRF